MGETGGEGEEEEAQGGRCTAAQSPRCLAGCLSDSIWGQRLSIRIASSCSPSGCGPAWALFNSFPTKNCISACCWTCWRCLPEPWVQAQARQFWTEVRGSTAQVLLHQHRFSW